ncbi:LOW QUALITY PROTEIN: 39S ribosomal protein L2, mitochondrial-like [Homalodisca vitripennis]|uniref:LOW QUALITY PROTEIN: 39S ribosomal protein L2, mitochondrial-like n=1 Tax=Homalodisca vitripennis TaxID=197043 RepID=UPI001EEA274F|nr:LOW QUALITY PROTEIN: 39S ribosomal protein L2, mitochondrial-like [Homalodisca vitripennis]
MDNQNPINKRCVDLLRSFGLELLVKSPTRVTATTQSAIDNIISNIPGVAVSVVNTAISDHCGQEAVIRGKHFERELKITKQKGKSTTDAVANLVEMVVEVNPNEGDAYPLGALPMGTKIHCVEKFTGTGGYYVHAAGSSATILRKMGDKVVVQLPSKIEVALPPENMCVVGQLSNIHNDKMHIGSPNRLRELGYRPRSGLFQLKTGRFGRKIYALPPVKEIVQEKKEEPEYLTLTLSVTKRPSNIIS